MVSQNGGTRGGEGEGANWIMLRLFVSYVRDFVFNKLIEAPKLYQLEWWRIRWTMKSRLGLCWCVQDYVGLLSCQFGAEGI